MPIAADTKDWTWVLSCRCPECGFEAAAVDVPQLPNLFRDLAAASWQGVLLRPDVRTRPAPDVWSALEYAAHVRDVFLLFGRRLTLMLAADDPLFESWDQDDAAVAGRYGEQDPAVVAAELAQAARALAGLFAGVPAAQYDRTGRRSDGARFTVRTLGQYGLHEAVHHLWDVTHDR